MRHQKPYPKLIFKQTFREILGPVDAPAPKILESTPEPRLTTHCKYGHKRQPGQLACLRCQRLVARVLNKQPRARRRKRELQHKAQAAVKATKALRGKMSESLWMARLELELEAKRKPIATAILNANTCDKE